MINSGSSEGGSVAVQYGRSTKCFAERERNTDECIANCTYIMVYFQSAKIKQNKNDKSTLI